MSTLPLTAAQTLTVRSIPGLARVGAFVTFMADVLADAHNAMREANKKYPYAGI